MPGMPFAVCDKMSADAVRKYDFSNNIDREFSNLNACRHRPGRAQAMAERRFACRAAAGRSTGLFVDRAAFARTAMLSPENLPRMV
jgi:SLT domain-containing protein